MTTTTIALGQSKVINCCSLGLDYYKSHVTILSLLQELINDISPEKHTVPY